MIQLIFTFTVESKLLSVVTQLSTITAEQLAMILKCNRYSSSSGSKSVWKLVLSETSQVLDQALDLLVNTV